MNISGLTGNHYQSQVQLTAPADEAAELEFQRQQAAAQANVQAANAAPPAKSVQTGSEQSGSEQSTSKKNESFINQMLEQLIAKRIGLDKKKLDEIKAEIEKLQQQRDALAEQGEASPKVAQQLQQIDHKIDALTKMMEQLIAQDLERRTEQDKQQLQAENTKNNLQQKYQQLV